MTTDPRVPTQRARGLLVRYWACNMVMAYDQSSAWPGFGYTSDEQATLRAIAQRVPKFEFMVWLSIAVVITLVFIAAFMLLGFGVLGIVTGDRSLQAVSAGAFFADMGCEIVACLAVGAPMAFLVAGVVTGKLFDVKNEDLPNARERAHFIERMALQFTRMGLILGGVVVALCLWLPERVWLLGRCVLPVLAPAVSIATAVYLFSRSSGLPDARSTD